MSTNADDPLDRRECPYCRLEIPGESPRCPKCNLRLSSSVTIGPSDREEVYRRLSILEQCSEWIVVLFSALGLFCHFLAYLGYRSPTLPSYWLGILLGGCASLCLGLTIAAKMKGRHWAWGMLGFLSVAGVLVAMVLPRRCLQCSGVRSWGGGCPACGPSDPIDGEEE